MTNTEDKEILGMDLLTYLEQYEPDELVKVGGDTYSTREHDSLKISNGKWFWFSRGIGGYTALDYLIKVRNMQFKDAAERIRGTGFVPKKIEYDKKEKEIKLPDMCPTSKNAVAYLINERHIDRDVAAYFADIGMIREDRNHKNIIFLGFDNENKIRYASMRSFSEKIFKECPGSQKEYSFRTTGGVPQFGLHVFESAIDLLSFLSLENFYENEFKNCCTLSLGGITGSEKIPLSVTRYLNDYPDTDRIYLHLDSDTPGRIGAKNLSKLLHSEGWKVLDEPPGRGKDVNDFLSALDERFSLTKEKEWWER